jgi:hypothetical protein
MPPDVKAPRRDGLARRGPAGPCIGGWRMLVDSGMVRGSMRRSILSLLLLALLFRAYIPVGFMPASGAPFLLKVCPMGMQGTMDEHLPMGGHTHGEECPFGCASVAAGPVPHTIAYEPGRLVVAHSTALHAAEAIARRERAHPPRGPPTLA